MMGAGGSENISRASVSVLRKEPLGEFRYLEEWPLGEIVAMAFSASRGVLFTGHTALFVSS